VSQEKTTALVIRQADWSESSRVVTLFTRDFGKISVVAKGARRLKSAFEAGLDLLSECRIVFLRKSSSSLDILTESQLQKRFSPAAGSLKALYAGYYLCELLNGLTEPYDPHPALYDVCVETLARLSCDVDPLLPLTRFELVLLREMGQLPEFDACLACDKPVHEETSFSFWVSQGGLLCADCRRPEYDHKPIHAQTIEILRQLATVNVTASVATQPGADQLRQIRSITIAAICHHLERRPVTLRYLD
jgi:DNA repair protein RecO (recombination protein O)